MRTLIIVILTVFGLFLAYQVTAGGDAVVGFIIAGGVATYLWREGMKGGDLAFVGLLGGLILLGVAAAATIRDARSVHWASTPGTVGWAQPICTTHSYGSDGWNRWRPFTICQSRIYYRYHVGDRDYAGTQVTFNDVLLTATDWNWEARYESSPHVTVRYDPADPAVAALEARTPGRTLLWVVGAVFTLGLGRAFLTNRAEADDAN